MKKNILDMTGREIDKFWRECDMECNSNKPCPLAFGRACLCDALDRTTPDKTVRQLIEELKNVEVEL